MSETIYFVHMYFVAFCSLVLYKGNYHNFMAYFICAGGATTIALLYQIQKNKKGTDSNYKLIDLLKFICAFLSGWNIYQTISCG